MKRLSLIVILLLLQSTISALTIHGSFFYPQTHYQFNYTVTSNTLYVNYQLYLTPFYSSALLVGSNSPFNVSYQREDWTHFLYLKSTNCDYQGMVTGGAQYAWVQNKGIGSQVTFKLINFNPIAPFAYIINITESNSFLRSCSSGLMVSSNGEYCQFCDPSHIGAECSIKRRVANPDSQNLLDLLPQSYTYYYIQSSSDIILNLFANQTVFVYLQTATFQQELAGIVNYLDGDRGSFSLIRTVSLQFSSQESKLTLGIINPHPNTVSFSLYYTQKTEINIVIIVISVIGGLILIAMIIAAIFIVRKMSNSRRQVLPQTALFRKKDRRLTQDEIETYFPPVALSVIQPKLDNSTLYVKQETMSEIDKLECIICLCEIMGEEMIRVGYCRHIFHANCLSQWFKKQQSCPYCRCEYNRQQTLQLYNKLIKRTGKTLVGTAIVRALFQRGDGPSLNTINETELGGVE